VFWFGCNYCMGSGMLGNHNLVFRGHAGFRVWTKVDRAGMSMVSSFVNYVAISSKLLRMVHNWSAACNSVESNWWGSSDIGHCGNSVGQTMLASTVVHGLGLDYLEWFVANCSAGESHNGCGRCSGRGVGRASIASSALIHAHSLSSIGLFQQAFIAWLWR